MGVNLDEINLLLFEVNRLSLGKTGADEDNVISILSHYCFNGKMINERENIATGIRLGLLKRFGKRLRLTENGRQLYLMRTVEGEITNLTPNTAQKQFLLEILTRSRALSENLYNILSNFRLDFNSKTWFYDSQSPDEGWPKDIVDALFQSDLLQKKHDRIEVAQEKNAFLSKVRNRILRSDDELMDLMGRQKVTGDVAEQLTVEYEKKRLSQTGMQYLALAVHRISREDVYAGYDIISFDGRRSGLLHDRFIEVKGTSGKVPIFYWSRNEIAVAKRYGEKYWIYIWTNVNSQSEPILYKSIRNPYKLFFSDSKIKPKPVLFAVEL